MRRAASALVFVLAASCGPRRYVVAPMPPRPASLVDTVPWPYQSRDGSATPDWCDYACGRFRRPHERVIRCRQALLAYPLQRSLGVDQGVACELR
jgi:hypothetical protein